MTRWSPTSLTSLCLCTAFGMFALELTGAGRLAEAQSTYEWPEFQPALRPGPSNTDVKAKPPAMTLSPPAVGTSPDRAKFSGYWEGWMCRDKIVDVNVLVTKVTNKGAKVRYAVASEHVDSLKRRPVSIDSARFKGDVLQFGERKTKIILGMRPDGYMNIKWDVTARGSGWCTGIMQRTLAPPPGAASTKEKKRTSTKPDP